jgi:beta-mannosidase
MTDQYRLPKDFPSLVYLSMVLQAEGIRYGVEHWRRHIDRVSGTLYWQLNDCWPVASWSSLDYYGRWKALHYAARRFYAPLLLSIEDKEATMGIYVTNDRLEPWKGMLRWSLETLSGDVLAQGEAQVETGPQTCIHAGTRDFSDHVSDENRRDLVFVAELWQADQRLALQTAALVPTKHLSLVDPDVDATLGNEAGQLMIELTSKSLALSLEVSLEGQPAVFSENYFDLPAGRMVTVSCQMPEGWTVNQARAGLKFRSVFDSYAHGA